MERWNFTIHIDKDVVEKGYVCLVIFFSKSWVGFLATIGLGPTEGDFYYFNFASSSLGLGKVAINVGIYVFVLMS